MWITKKQDATFLMKAFIRIVDYALSRSQADFIEIFATIDPCFTPVTFNLKGVKSF